MQVGRLLDQTGGSRSFHEDHISDSGTSVLRAVADEHRGDDGASKQSVRISLVQVVDEESGDVRIVRADQES